VSDSGIGISKEDQQKLFHIEAKHSTRGTEGEEGSGLGLVLCAEIVEKHGGTISIESEVGKGTMFVFALLLPRKTILVAEDDKADRLLTVRFIEQCYPDYSVIEASDGESAFKLALQHLPSIIIADFVMPVMDGLKLMKELKRNQTTKGIPVISVTSVQSQGSAADLRAAGAVDVLLKPFSKAELCAVVERFVK
jgi:CheY-like chemotaxis protein